MWLQLTLLKLEGTAKKQTSRVIVSRINMDKVISYYEAPEDVRNHTQENLRVNTFMMLDLEGNRVFSVKETVEQIDDMIAAYGSEETNVDTLINVTTEKVKPEVWGKSTWD